MPPGNKTNAPRSPEALARQQIHTSLLNEVWGMLEGIHPAGEQRSITDLGFVAAASTTGVTLRILLRVPGAFCRDSNSALVTGVTRALSSLPCLRDVHVSLKVHRPTLVHDDAAGLLSENVLIHSDSVLPGGDTCDNHPHSHARCLEQAIAGMRYHGWELGGFQQHRFVTSSPEEIEETDTVHVTVQAWIEAEANRPCLVTGNPLGAT